MKKIAVFVSGRGTNLGAIIASIRAGKLKAELALVVSDRKKAPALAKAAAAGFKTLFLDPRAFSKRQEYEAQLIRHLRKEKVDLIILAGFMRILTPFFVKKYKNRILNIHPALLPAFPGGCAIKDAYRYGAGVTGVTVHFVDEQVDHGPIIMQEALSVRDSETMEELERRIHEVEHRLYSRAIAKVLSGGISVKGRRVVSA
ncbi:MAG: phosphoribosylglycinamide formyltransferase [Candidatus Omnitrophota bacterium]